MLLILAGFWGEGTAFAQSSGERLPAEGRWWGLLMVGERPQRISLDINRGPEGQWSGYIDLLRTNDRRVPLVDLRAAGDELMFQFTLSGNRTYRFEGVIDGYVLEGNVDGEGVEGRIRAEREVPRRPRVQEPVGVVPYQVRDVEVGANGVKLPGTLTMPATVGEGGVPGVLLVAAPNARGRDQDAAGHKPFLVLADRLTRAGFAVLRYDDRTMYTAGVKDVSDVVGDAEAALRLLSAVPGVRPGAVGVVAHGEGALVAMRMLAAEGSALAFAVLMNAPGVRGIDLKPRQISQDMVSSQMPPGFARQYLTREMAALEAVMCGDKAALREAVIRLIALRSGDQREEVFEGEERFGVQADFEMPRYDTAWNKYYLSVDPAELLRKSRVPVLVLHGGKDQMHHPDDNLPPLEEALKASTSPSYAIEVLPVMNHQLQTAETGARTEVAVIEESVNEELMKRIAQWIGTVLRGP